MQWCASAFARAFGLCTAPHEPLRVIPAFIAEGNYQENDREQSDRAFAQRARAVY